MLTGKIKTADYYEEEARRREGNRRAQQLGQGARAGRLLSSGKPGHALGLLMASSLLSGKTAGVTVVAFGDELNRLLKENQE